MNNYHYCYRRCEGGMMLTGSLFAPNFEKVVDVLHEVSTDTMEIIYILKIEPEQKR